MNVVTFMFLLNLCKENSDATDCAELVGASAIVKLGNVSIVIKNSIA